MHCSVVLLVLCLFNVKSSSGHYRNILEQILDRIDPRGMRHVKTKWIAQPLDHFNSDNKGRWSMRYFERKDMFKSGSPIVMFIGGEGEADGRWLTIGSAFEIAKENNAAMYMSEHRYYGKSQPVEKRKFQYLSSRQALADLAFLIRDIKKNDPELRDSKVIAIGGSYPANMAVWMRLFYPDLIHSALASSGPVLAKLDYLEYIETVGNDYKEYGGNDCYDKIHEKFSRYDTLLKTPEGIDQLKKEENICESSNMTIDYNQHLFMFSKIGRFMSNSQYGSPQKIADHCKDILGNDKSRHSYSLLTFIDVFSKPLMDSFNCEEVDLDKEIQQVRFSEYYPWLYQKCTEFSYAKTTKSTNHPFTDNCPLRTFYKICREAFDEAYSSTKVDNSVENTNNNYGGLSVINNVTRVVFTNFNIDPWHRLGIYPSSSSNETQNNNYILFGKNGSHCQDLVPVRKGESANINDIRVFTKSLLKTWLNED